MATSGAKNKSIKSKQPAKKVSRKKPVAPKPGKASPKTDLNGMELLLLDNCPDGIVAVDRRGIVRYVNSAAEILLGPKPVSWSIRNLPSRSTPDIHKK